MVKLIARSAAECLLPMDIGEVQVAELAGPLYSVAPFAGQGAGVASALGLDALPAPGQSRQAETGLCAWFGHAHWLLMDWEAPPSLSGLAAVTDQTDAWCRVQLTGGGVRDVLARLTPVDQREGAFPVGAILRTDVQHMSGVILRSGGDTWQVMVFRSMAGTLVHDLRTVMTSVAAR